MAARPRGNTKFLVECWKIFHSFAALTREIFFNTRREISLSPSGHVMCYLLYEHQWNTKTFHFNSFFVVKGKIYYLPIATAIFSCVKITCFRAKVHMVFHWCLYNKCLLTCQGRSVYISGTEQTDKPRLFPKKEMSLHIPSVMGCMDNICFITVLVL